MKAISKLLRIVSTAMLTVMIVLAFLLVGVKFLGFEVYTVLSGSMEPVYHTGSVIYVKDADAEITKLPISSLRLDAILARRSSAPMRKNSSSRSMGFTI